MMLQHALRNEDTDEGTNCSINNYNFVPVRVDGSEMHFIFFEEREEN